MKKKVTLIIPHKEKTPKAIEPLLENIQKWTSYPDEIIIINSSSFKLNIDFFLNFCKKKKISLHLENNLDLHPGSSRNYGILKSKNETICFLDVKTIPQDNWFKKGVHKVKLFMKPIIIMKKSSELVLMDVRYILQFQEVFLKKIFLIS